MKRKEAFDTVAKIYDEVRPSYPNELIENIVENTKVDKKSKLLEVGAGTGKATIQMAEKGLNIHCVELGANLAEILKDKCKEYLNVKVDISSFEEWKQSEYEQFDLIYSAQAFHWMDEKTKYKRCHELLKEDGYLALFWYQGVSEKSEVGDELGAMIENYVPGFSNKEVCGQSHEESLKMRKKEILDSKLFKDIKIFEYPFENKMNADEYLKVLSSYSKFTCLEEKIKEKILKETKEIIEKHGGFVSSKLMYSLFISKRI